MQRHSLLCQPLQGEKKKKKIPLFRLSAPKKLVVLEGKIVLLQDLWATTNSLARPGRAGNCDLKPTQVHSILLQETLIFPQWLSMESSAWSSWDFYGKDQQSFYTILSENSWKEKKCGIIPLWRMHVLGCCNLPPGRFCSQAKLILVNVCCRAA